jgi:hypothetical protein
VHVDLVANDGGGYDGVFAVLLFESFELIENFLGGDCLLVDPPLLALCGLDLDETAPMLKDLELVPVFDCAGSIGDCRYTVAEEGLFRRDIDVLRRRLGTQLRAAAQGYCQRDASDACQPRKRLPWTDLSNRRRNKFETPLEETANPIVLAILLRSGLSLMPG